MSKHSDTKSLVVWVRLLCECILLHLHKKEVEMIKVLAAILAAYIFCGIIRGLFGLG